MNPVVRDRAYLEQISKIAAFRKKADALETKRLELVKLVGDNAREIETMKKAIEQDSEKLNAMIDEFNKKENM